MPTLLRRLVTSCLVEVGWLLQRSLQLRRAAVATYWLAERQLADSGDLPLSRMVAQATLNRGLALGELGMYQQEMAAYDQVIERFGHLRDQTLQSTVTWAIVNRGAVMIKVGRNLEAVALYESVVLRLRRTPEAAEAHRAAVDNLAMARLLGKAAQRAPGSPPAVATSARSGSSESSPRYWGLPHWSASRPIGRSRSTAPGG